MFLGSYKETGAVIGKPEKLNDFQVFYVPFITAPESYVCTYANPHLYLNLKPRVIGCRGVGSRNLGVLSYFVFSRNHLLWLSLEGVSFQRSFFPLSQFSHLS